MSASHADRAAVAESAGRARRRSVAKGAVASAGAAVAYAAPTARLVRVARAQQAVSPPPVNGGGGDVVLTAQAVLVAGSPVTVRPLAPVLATVDFGVQFSAVTLVCINVVFVDDLLDAGDAISYDFGPGFSGPGIGNVGPGPQAARTVCTLEPSTHALFLDGREAFAIHADVGTTVTIQSLSVTVHGRLAQRAGAV